jgi:hypothetical protein
MQQYVTLGSALIGWLVAHSTLLSQGQIVAPFVERRILGCQVSLHTGPPPRVTSYWVKEHPPFGKPSNISHGGSFDPATRTITFGPFYGLENLVLSYVDDPPEGAAGQFPVTGEVLADGSPVPIVGDSYVDLAPFPPPSLRLLLRLRPMSDDAVVQVEGERGAVYQVQTTSNLVNWSNAVLVATPEGIGEWIDPEPPGSACRFYRAWLVPSPAQPFGNWDYQGYDSSGQLIISGFLMFTTATPPFSGTWDFQSLQLPRSTAHYMGEGTFDEVTLAGTTVTVDVTPPGMVDNSFRLVGDMVTDVYAGPWFWDGEGPSQSGSFTAQRQRLGSTLAGFAAQSAPFTAQGQP